MKKIDKRDIEDILALTPMQAGMLFLYLKDPLSDYYFEQLSLEVSGRVDLALLEKAWNWVTMNNEMLRTSFHWEKLNKPAQTVLRNHTVQLAYHDLSMIEESAGKKRLVEKIKQEDRDKKFDLREVPFRVILCKILENRYCMIISYHHILMDGWSTGIILKEFIQAYDALCKGVYWPGQQRKPSFKEFIDWHRKRNRDKEKSFWQNYLQGMDAKTRFPIKKMQLEPNTTGGDVYGLILEKNLKEKLAVFLKENRITMAAFFYFAWGILLRTYCGSDDVVFGTTVSGRSVPLQGIEEIVGLFINTVPLRIQTHSHEKIADRLSRLNQALQMREVYENSSLADIKEYSGATANEELFDTAVVIENYPLNNLSKQTNGPLSFDSYSMFEMTHYDCTVCITPGDKITINFHYRKGISDRETIIRLAHHFAAVVENLIDEPGNRISSIDITPVQEKRQISVDFNSTDLPYPRDKTIQRLFEEQAARTPDHMALVGSGQDRGLPTSNLHLTYRELDKKTGQLARVLREKGITRDVIAAVMVDRSLDMVIGILSILKADGAYLPIEPGYPPERIGCILKDSRTRLLLTQRNFERKTAHRCEVLHLDDSYLYDNDPTQLPGLKKQSWRHQLAYIIYTSGSTGTPKGVAIEQEPVVNLLTGLNKLYPFTMSDVYLLKTSYLFDVSVTELFGWFPGGGKLVLLEKDGEKNLREIIKAIEYYGVTHINFVPSQFNVFVDLLTPRDVKRISGLKYIFLAGEALLPELVDKFKALNCDIPLENLYGPTEATVYASFYSLTQWQGRSAIPIGKPFYNTILLILNRDGGIQPVGIPGELCITGIGVARGYLNRPGLTAEKFDHNQKLLRGVQGGGFLEKSPPGRRRQNIYKTGDLAKWLPDGDIEFLGRIDQQVKIRGFRIELGEIENRLLNHQAIKEAVVTTKPDKIGDRYLCAYVVPYSPGTVEIAQLKYYLQQKLPYYMVPAYFVIMEEIPLTATGKVDRQSLPSPGRTPTKEYAAPRNEREEIVTAIWSEILGIEKEKIGIDDNFFELGGNSLKATQLVGRIHKAFSAAIPIAGLVFTVRGICGYIQEAGKTPGTSIEPIEKKQYYPLSSTQARLYFLQQMNEAGTVYNMPSAWVLEGAVDKEKLGNTLEKLIQRHESLRTSFAIVEDEPVQRIHDEVEFEIECCSQGPGPYTHTIKNFIRPFNLSQASLLRVGLIGVEKGPCIFMVDIHHIITDGISMQILLKEFHSSITGKELPPLRLQYKDYTQWEHRLLGRGKLKKHEEYWLSIFKDKNKIPVLNLPTDYPRPSYLDFNGNSFKFEIDGQSTKKLKEFAAQTGTTLFMVLAAVYIVFLSKYTGQKDIIVGIPIAGRTHDDLKNIIGMFVNMLPLRNFPEGSKTFRKFLEEVKGSLLNALENQDYQLDTLVEKLGIKVDPSRHPLVETVVTLDDMTSPQEISRFQWQAHRANNAATFSLRSTSQEVERNISKFDLKLAAFETPQGVAFNFEYRNRLFQAETIESMSHHFKILLEKIMGNTDREISEIDILDQGEIDDLLEKVRTNDNFLPVSHLNTESTRHEVQNNEGDFIFNIKC
jgi:amino acid adenylation domain-containing protein